MTSVYVSDSLQAQQLHIARLVLFFFPARWQCNVSINAAMSLAERKCQGCVEMIDGYKSAWNLDTNLNERQRDRETSSICGNCLYFTSTPAHTLTTTP